MEHRAFYHRGKQITFKVLFSTNQLPPSNTAISYLPFHRVFLVFSIIPFLRFFYFKEFSFVSLLPSVSNDHAFSTLQDVSILHYFPLALNFTGCFHFTRFFSLLQFDMVCHLQKFLLYREFSFKRSTFYRVFPFANFILIIQGVSISPQNGADHIFI